MLICICTCEYQKDNKQIHNSKFTNRSISIRFLLVCLFGSVQGKMFGANSVMNCLIPYIICSTFKYMFLTKIQLYLKKKELFCTLKKKSTRTSFNYSMKDMWWKHSFTLDKKHQIHVTYCYLQSHVSSLYYSIGAQHLVVTALATWLGTMHHTEGRDCLMNWDCSTQGYWQAASWRGGFCSVCFLQLIWLSPCQKRWYQSDSFQGWKRRPWT